MPLTAKQPVPGGSAGPANAGSESALVAWWQAPAREQRSGASTAESTPWSYYGQLLRRNLWQLVTLVSVVTVVATLISLTRPKQFESLATLQIDALGAQVVGGDSLQRSADAGAEAEVVTDEAVLTSPAVLLQVIEQLHLQGSPEFRGSSDPNRTPSPNQVLKVLRNRVGVNRPAGSLLLNVSFRAHDAQLASQVTNGIAQAFLDLEYRSRAQALNQSTQYMTGQLDSLRAQMEESQQALVNYESRANILDPDSKDNIMVARLTQLNTDLVHARDERMKMQAAVQVIAAGATAGWVNPGLAQELQSLRGTLKSDQRQLQRLAQVYGPSHPVYRQEQAVVAADEQAVRQAQDRLAQAARAEFVAAGLQETLLSSAVDQQKKAMDLFNQRAITYRSLQASAQNYSKLYYDLLQSIAKSKLAAGFHATNARIVSQARPIYEPVSPRPKLTAAVALLLSLLFGAGFVVVRDALDQSVSSADQVELLFRAPVLGILPLVKAKQVNSLHLLGTEEPGESERRHPFREAVLSLQSAVQLGSGEAPQVTAITSALPGEGKSTAAGHLALAAAQVGHRTILVDADLRKPRAHRLFGLANPRGLSEVLRGTLDLEAAIQPSGRANLAVLPAGPVLVNSAEMLQQHWAAVLGDLRQRYDRVIVDCAPTLGFADSGAVARQADALLLLVRAGRTGRNFVRGALRQLAVVGAEVSGVVLNGVSGRLDPYYYYQDAYGVANDADIEDDEEGDA